MARISKANRPLFDLDLLRAIVAVADHGSFTIASARLYSTQSTMSQKVLRLERKVGHRLLERGNQGVRVTDAGETLLAYARRMLALNDEMFDALSGVVVASTIRVGLPEDFAGRRATQSLAAFSRRHPGVKLEVTSGLSRDLASAYDRGELDLVLVKQKRDSRESVARWPERLCWIDSAKNPAFAQDPLPLVAFPPRGLYRDEMIASVERIGRRWHIAYTSSSLAGIQFAVADGLGISLLPARAVTADHLRLSRRSGLLEIDTMDIALLHRPGADAPTLDLALELRKLLARERV